MEREIDRRSWAAKAAEPAIDFSRYVWEYDRNDAGEWIPRDPAAPTWTIEAWRGAYDAESGGAEEDRSFLEAMVLGERPRLGGQPVTTTHLPKSPETLAELARIEADRDARLDVFGDLEEQLEEQRLREWAAYGEALKTRIEALAAATPGLDVPVRMTVDVETFRREVAQREGFWNSLESRLVDAAVLDTPNPADLPGTPLERLEQR